ncbi:BT_3044 domain-containing protein [Viscerimonas tarda]
MKKKHIVNILVIASLLFSLNSCNEDAIFEQELYKKVLALISTDGYNIFEETHELTGDETIGYVAVSVGGTTPTDKEVKLMLVEDSAAFNNYNRGNFDADESIYANLLPKDKYDIDDYTITVPTGERNGRMKIRVRAEGLSPDSIYFISLKVGELSAYELNPKKSDVLYRVLIKNRYASQLTSGYTNYSMRGNKDGVEVPGVKSMHPISKNRVRIMAGTEAFQSSVTAFNKSAIVLEVTDDNKVLITPYKDITVQQIDGDPDFPNVFKIEDDGYRKYNTFLLRYSYKTGNTTYQMKEELRMEIKE